MTGFITYCELKPQPMTPLVKQIKPYKHKELSDLYGVSRQTFSKWLIPFKDKIGKRQGHYYSVEQVKTIFASLGVPSNFDGDV
jgi:hypothetical protein